MEPPPAAEQELWDGVQHDWEAQNGTQQRRWRRWEHTAGEPSGEQAGALAGLEGVDDWVVHLRSGTLLDRGPLCLLFAHVRHAGAHAARVQRVAASSSQRADVAAAGEGQAVPALGVCGFRSYIPGHRPPASPLQPGFSDRLSGESVTCSRAQLECRLPASGVGVYPTVTGLVVVSAALEARLGFDCGAAQSLQPVPLFIGAGAAQA